MPEERKRVEPWPLGLGLALAFVVAVCLAFWGIAASHPDPLVGESQRPGLER